MDEWNLPAQQFAACVQVGAAGVCVSVYVLTLN